MDLLARVGQGLIDIEDGRASAPTPEGLAHCRELLRDAGGCPEQVEECGRGLVAYVLAFEDYGLAVQTWREEWSL
jgi:hypothetical protein